MTTLASHPASPLERAVESIGSQSATGRLLGVSQRAVWRWLHEKKALPAEHVLTVERETGISRHELRPDIYPPAADDRAVAPPAANGACDPAPLSHRGAA